MNESLKLLRKGKTTLRWEVCRSNFIRSAVKAKHGVNETQTGLNVLGWIGQLPVVDTEKTGSQSENILISGQEYDLMSWFSDTCKAPLDFPVMAIHR